MLLLSIENPIITEDSSFLDRLGLGGQTLLVGMLVVFAMLFVIYLVMIALQAFFTKKKNSHPTEAPASETQSPIPNTPDPAPAISTNDTDIIAAITAAIAAYTDKSPSSFRVVSFKRRR